MLKTHIEYKNADGAEDLRHAHGLEHTVSLYNSDAHHLWDIAEPCHVLDLPVSFPTPSDVIRYLQNAGTFTSHS